MAVDPHNAPPVVDIDGRMLHKLQDMDKLIEAIDKLREEIEKR